jgi:hypothetical protein
LPGWWCATPPGTGLGEVLLAKAQPGPAHSRHAEALALAREISNRNEQARAHNGLGSALLAEGLASQARAQYAAALALAGESGDPYQQDRARDGLAFSERAYAPGRSRLSTAGRECPKTTGSPHDSHTSRALSG